MNIVPDRRLKLAAIDFLNPAPLMWDFEHEPEKSRLAERYEIRYSTPSRCAEDLFTGVADIGLVPAAAYAIDPTMIEFFPDARSLSKARIRSIILVTREDGPEAANTIALGHFVADVCDLHRDPVSQILESRSEVRSPRTQPRRNARRRRCRTPHRRPRTPRP